MPNYDYICNSCQKRAKLFFSYAEYGQKKPICPHCQSDDLKRHIGRVAVGRSEANRVDSLMDDSALANLDGDDPKALGSFMRKMSHELGENMGDDFNEVVDRLEKGESPEKIEKSMPDLAKESPTSD